MKFTVVDPPRVFNVGRSEIIQLKDCAHIELEPDEQVTFMTESGAEYDVARKSWGFYATPSLNGRLQKFGLRGVLVKSPDMKFYVFLVERGKESDFHHYLNAEGQTIVCWLDSNQELQTLERKLNSARHEG
ncbi:MAG: hypothetical protein MN733_39650 [Nitrososphaera sp.]|nr:hypothetical protein [Nitrososphaera sp.]